MLKIAKTLYRQGKFTEAESVYSERLASDPQNAAVLRGLGTIALWNNRPEEAERYLKRAADNASWFQNLWPFNIRLKMRLAMTYYRADRFEEAAPLFKAAAGPLVWGPFEGLQAMGKQMAMFGKEAPYLIEGPEETQVNFITTDPLPVIKVSINGSRPLLFFIDTGGLDIILDTDLAREVRAEIAGEMLGEFAGSKKAATGLGRIDSIIVGDFVVKNVPITTLDIAKPVSRVFNGLDIKGVIGTRFLMHFLSTIDYANGALILRRATPLKLEELETEIKTQESKVIPFWLIESHYIVAWGTVNAIGPMLFFVDTGLAGKGFTATESILQEAGVTVDWTKAYESTGGGGKIKEVDIFLNQLTLGSGSNEVLEKNVPGAVIEGNHSVLRGVLGFKVGGLISHQFFRDYALTFDFKNMRLILQH